MRPFRRPEEALAIVRARAARQQRRRLVLGAAIAAGAVIVLVVGLALRGGGDGGSPAAPTVPPGPAPAVDVVGADNGLPDGFNPLAVVAGPNGWVTATAQAAGEQGRPNPVWRSADARTWEAPAADVFGPLTVNALAATPQRFVVAVTAPDGSGQLLASADGTAWQAIGPLEAGDTGTSLRAAGDRFYRSTSAGLQVSADGAVWTPAGAGGQPLTGVSLVTTTGTTYLAVGLAADGTVTGMWGSPDGTTFTALPTPAAIPGVAAVAGGGGAAVAAYRGTPSDAGCDAAAGPQRDCTWPMSFTPLDPATGAAAPAPAAAFTTADPDPHLVAGAAGWVALQRDGDKVVVWSSADGRAWGRSGDTLPVATGTRSVAAGGATAVAVAGAARGDAPRVGLITAPS